MNKITYAEYTLRKNNYIYIQHFTNDKTVTVKIRAKHDARLRWIRDRIDATYSGDDRGVIMWMACQLPQTIRIIHRAFLNHSNYRALCKRRPHLLSAKKSKMLSNINKVKAIMRGPHPCGHATCMMSYIKAVENMMGPEFIMDALDLEASFLFGTKG